MNEVVIALPSKENDYKAWSGVNYYLNQSFKKQFQNSKFVYLKENRVIIFRIILKIYRFLYFTTHFKKTKYIPRWYSFLLYSKSIKEITKYKPALVFTTSVLLASFMTRYKVVYIIDSTVRLLVNYLWFKLSKDEIKTMEKNQLFALRNSSYIICASSWAKESVVSDYGIEENKVSVVHFGANLPYINIFSKSLSKNINILFCATIKKEKGFDIAVEVVKYLNHLDRNRKYRLLVLGLVGESNDQVEYLGIKHKNNPKEFEEFVDIFKRSHLFLLPTRAECFGIVFCEAFAFSLPVIGTNTGGVSSYVINGYNGFTIASNENISTISSKIISIVSDNDYYKTICDNAREFYEQHTNWDIFSRKVKEITEK